MPLGLEVGDGGVYCTNGNDLVHLSDKTGSGHADTQRPVLRGFFTGDSHQDINSFIWGPGGELMFCQGFTRFPASKRRGESNGWKRPACGDIAREMAGSIRFWGGIAGRKIRGELCLTIGASRS